MQIAPYTPRSRKARWSAQDEANAILMAGGAARGVPHTLPVLGGGRVLGFVTGVPEKRASIFRPLPKYETAYDSYDKVVNQMTADPPQRWTFIYEKNENTATVAQNWFDMWPVRGNPTQGVYTGAARTAVQIDDTVTGSMYIGGSVSPKEKYLLHWMPFVFSSGNTRCWMLYDRVLTYEACTMAAGSLSMTNGVAAQRYISTGQPGLQICMTTQTNHNATAANLTTLNYVNQSGAAAAMPTTRTVAKIVSVTAGSSTLGSRVFAPADTATTQVWQPFLPLAAGDTGVQSITDYTWSAAPTGTFCAVLLYPLAFVTDGNSQAFWQIQDLLNTIGGPSRLYDGACVSMLLYGISTNATNVFAMGDVGWTT